MKSRVQVRNRYFLLGDLILIVLSVVISYFLGLELGPVFTFYFNPSGYWMILAALLVKPLVYYLFGLYRRLWVYASVQEMKLIAAAVTTASIPLSIIMLALFQLHLFPGFPRRVLAIDWLVSILAVGGLRFVMRLLAENNRIPNDRIGTAFKRVLIVGAGDAGVLVVRELQKNPQLNLTPVGFLDDNPEKLNHDIYGVPVVGTLTDMARVLDNLHADEVLIAIPSAPGRVVRLVADVCRLKGVPFRTMPGIYELIGGKVNISRLREVDISDLLRREPVPINDHLVGGTLTGRVILVTGAGGSIGRELCRQIARWGPVELILLGHGENSIFEAWIELQESFPSLSMRPVIADVRDIDRLRNIFEQHHPQVVFHAAAHKHVPLMEINITEAIKNNILGTRNVIQVCSEFQVDRLVMISTDKAIRPRNIMGATKRVAEMMVLDAARRGKRGYSVVRFGNVLGSRGSVVPLFKRQIARGGPVTITHPDMKRYFMTIPEAVHLVLQASALGEGGELFVLNMGQQVRILDLAEDLIRLSGLEPGKDIEIIFTGIRAGEKLSEDLWDEGNVFEPTDHPEIFRLDGQDVLSNGPLEQAVDELLVLAQDGDTQAILTRLDELVPGSEVRSTPPPEMTAID